MGWAGAYLLFFNFLKETSSTPVVLPPAPIADTPFIPKDFCYLPPIYGFSASMKYVEDCDSLDQYPLLPIPVSLTQKSATHPMVCCPEKRYKSDICFPHEPWCPTYKEPVYDTPDYAPGDYSDYEGLPEQPTLADRKCYGTPLGNGLTLDTCVPIIQCSSLLDLAPTNAPSLVMQACGFDEGASSLMICCPDSLINSTAPALGQPPRFPQEDGTARPCADRHDLCQTWKENEGCALDRKFELTEDPNGHVDSTSMFDLMQGTCMETCGWCGDKGCVDEHPNCPVWTRNGMCVLNPFVMAHTCRESCGLCGFLAPTNSEEQVVGQDSYTDFTRDNFDCGRFKLLTEVNPQEAADGDEISEEMSGIPAVEVTTEDTAVDYEEEAFDLRSTDDDDVFFSSQGLPGGSDPTKPDLFCGATIVSDRWVVAAAHCYDDFGAGASGGSRQVKVNNIRENTVYKDIIDVKRIFKHPLYKYPNLYNDVAVLELGRRIEYDWDVFGDSPSCIDLGNFEKEGKIATIQGYGLTENGTRGDLLETNVTIISNQECAKILEHNTTDNVIAKRQLENALPQGLNYGLLCAQGEYVNGIFKGSCKGDSGGPLTAKNLKDRTTLVGIVSGGVGCGKGYPGWYTRVDFFADWIKCIIRTSRQSLGRGMSQQDVEESCEQKIIQPKTCDEISVEELLFGDLRSDEECGDEFLYGGLSLDDELFGNNV